MDSIKKRLQAACIVKGILQNLEDLSQSLNKSLSKWRKGTSEYRRAILELQGATSEVNVMKLRFVVVEITPGI